MRTREFDHINGKLDGIAAKLEVMAAAFQKNAGTPAPEMTEAALLSIAEEIQETRAAFLELWEAEKG